ncbi:hypothetical protein ACK301_18975 [Aeromonas caviae]
MQDYLIGYILFCWVLFMVGLIVLVTMQYIYELIIPFERREAIKRNIDRYKNEWKDEWIVSFSVKIYKFITGAGVVIFFLLLAGSVLESCSKSIGSNIDAPICMPKFGCF